MKERAEGNNRQPLDQERRTFVTKSTVVGVGAVAAAVLPGVVIANTVESPSEPKKQQKGYQLTDHVADYYKSASI
jgi:hypothetical protein